MNSSTSKIDKKTSTSPVEITSSARQVEEENSNSSKEIKIEDFSPLNEQLCWVLIAVISGLVAMIICILFLFYCNFKKLLSESKRLKSVNRKLMKVFQRLPGLTTLLII